MAKRNSHIPRWQQGPRPGAFGDTWDAMTPRERRWAFVTDLAVAIAGAALLYWVF